MSLLQNGKINQRHTFSHTSLQTKIVAVQYNVQDSTYILKICQILFVSKVKMYVVVNYTVYKQNEPILNVVTTASIISQQIPRIGHVAERSF